MAIRKNLSTPEMRAFWKTAEEAAERVKKWPAWKRGESEPKAIMKTNGYKLREAIKVWEMRRELAEDALNKALFVFPGEEKDQMKVDEYWGNYAQAEQSIARLQTAQVRYNLEIKVRAGEMSAPLAYAIKYIGSVQRFVKLWKGALTKGTVKDDPYGRRSALIRKEDEIHAHKTIPDVECRENVLRYKQEENQLRAAIATANAEELEIEGLDETLFPAG